MSGGVVGRVKGGYQLELEWEIPDFLLLQGPWHDSPEYFFGNTSWCIRVYPDDLMIKGWINMYIIRGDSGPPVTATCSLFLKTTKETKAVLTDKEKAFSKKGDVCGFRHVHLKMSELIDQKSELLRLGVLTVVCTLNFKAERQNEDFLSQNLRTTATPDKKFVRDYQELLLNREGSDITLMVKGQKFEAHRAFLRARSPVFASMLHHDMKEKNTGQIDIADCDPEYFQDFLRFLYCGSVDSVTSQNACCLYRAADKYDVQDLKSECLAFMRSHLDVENFCDILTVALQHSESDLIKLATRFFAENMKKIILTVKWQVFLAENPTQSNELLIKALGHYQLIN